MSPTEMMEPCGVHSIDKEKLKQYLIKSVGVGSTNDELVLKQFDEGQSNPTYYLRFGGKEMVLRKKPPGKLLRGAHQIDREFRVMNAVYKAGFPVPRMIDYCKMTSVIGTEFFLMEFLPGRVLNTNMVGLSSRDRRQCLMDATKTLAHLHKLDPNALGLGSYGKNKGFCGRVLSTWSKQYRSAADTNIPEMDQLINWLQNKLPSIKDESTIVHGDYSLSNIMFHPTESKVLAVLDWEISTIGHPLMDFAYLCLFYHSPKEYFVLQQLDDETLQQLFKDFPTEDELVKYYCDLRGIEAPIPNWNFYLALSFFKLTSIVQGVYARSQQGNASSPHASMYGYLIKPLILTALKLAKRSDLTTASMPMTLSPSPKGQETLDRVKDFVRTHVEPREKDYYDHIEKADSPFCIVPLMEEWKAKAKSRGLWNLFLPGISGLSNVDYAHIAEHLGRCPPSSEVFNCAAPDTGNMEVLHMYGDDYQKKTWLQPLLDGKIRSAFCMTEPQVASSDATNMELTIKRDGDYYIVNGRKWWSSGAARPRCAFGIVMGRTGSANTRAHKSHSMIIVPFDTPGVKRVRDLTVFGYNEGPGGHAEMLFDNVRVPLRNLILGEGRGFEIAQGRLGPGRIHHCMRSIGLAERAMELMVKRAAERKPFKKRILEHAVAQHQIADCRIAIDQCRLLTLNAAHMIDRCGAKMARKEIAMIKIAAPRMLCDVIDRAIQIHGGAGVSQDFPLAAWYAAARTLRIADGPDEVHLTSVAKLEIRDQLLKARM
ncbi:acyl-CoA dehydrogenase family member 11-like isoform X2 [Clavelina lepadiformis]|uniref:acyl-CoA dehydrogenase family member 11-like isoform X2 n=1 Tax=Clavelina lepadiformis TaxID=159417 RepID=UPI0040411074